MGISKENKKLWRLILIYGVIIGVVAFFIPKQHTWTPSFSKDYNWPFGSELIFNELEDIYGDPTPDVVDKSFYINFKDTSYINHNLIIINNDFQPDSLDLDQLYRFVKEGNQALIVCEDCSFDLLDSLGLESSSAFNWKINNLSEGKDARISLNFAKDEMVADTSYKFRAARYYSYFYKSDSNKTAYQLGWIQEDEIAFVRVPYGEGNFYLHSFPYAFTNYHILKEEVNPYISKALSVLPKQEILWDEYYKNTRGLIKNTPLYVMLRSKSFRWAYWLSLITLLLFIIFHAKRKQRVIPVIKPYKNDSLDFTKTISSLYYQRRDNLDLSLKKINYFREFVGATYHFRALKFTKEDAEELSHKSEFDNDFLDKMFLLIRQIQNSKTVSDKQLKELADHMNKIYNRKKILN